VSARATRRWLAAAALLLLGLPSPSAAGGLPRFGAEVGVSYGYLSYDVDGIDTELQIEPTAGVLAQWAFHGPWSLMSGLRYSRSSDKLTLEFPSTGGGTRMTGENTLDYLSIPARIELAPFADGRLGLAFGPEFAYLLQARREVTEETTPSPGPAKASADIFEDVGTFGREGDVTGDYERLDVRVSAGVLWKLPLGAHVGRVEARYAHGLTDTRKAESLAQRTRAFEFTVGMLW
jgi:hypothetical protein